MMSRHSKTPPENPNYIAYYRLSYPKRDPITGNIIHDPYGIDAQKNTILNYINSKNGVLVNEFIEMKSGNYKNREKRHEIKKAIIEAKKTKSILIFAYVDRIARDVEFTAHLQNTRVKFVCCDMPNANEFSINIMAAMAQEYSRSISEKIMRAFEVKRKRGDTFGCMLHRTPGCKLSPAARAIAAQNKKDAAALNPLNIKGSAKAFALHLQGYSFDQIAFVMNNQGFLSPKGFEIRRSTISKWIKPHVKDARELKSQLSKKDDNKHRLRFPSPDIFVPQENSHSTPADVTHTTHASVTPLAPDEN